MDHWKIKLQSVHVLPWSSQRKNEKNRFCSVSVCVCAAYTTGFGLWGLCLVCGGFVDLLCVFLLGFLVLHSWS